MHPGAQGLSTDKSLNGTNTNRHAGSPKHPRQYFINQKSQ